MYKYVYTRNENLCLICIDLKKIDELFIVNILKIQIETDVNLNQFLPFEIMYLSIHSLCSKEKPYE